MAPTAARPALSARLRRFWPEITGFLAMMAYTAARTVAVAKGIDSVSHTNWKVFLVIEIVMTIPYVWGIGDLVRGAVTGTHSRARDVWGIIAVLGGVVVPYIYIAAEGGLHHRRGLIITAVMVLLAVIGLKRALDKLAATHRERRAREAALLTQHGPLQFDPAPPASGATAVGRLAAEADEEAAEAAVRHLPLA